MTSRCSLTELRAGRNQTLHRLSPTLLLPTFTPPRPPATHCHQHRTPPPSPVSSSVHQCPGDNGETRLYTALDHQTLLPRNLWRFGETSQLFLVKWSENAKYAEALEYLECYRETLVSIVTAS